MVSTDDYSLFVAQRFDEGRGVWEWAFPEAERSQSYDLVSLRKRLVEEAEQGGEYRIVRTALAVFETFHFDGPRATVEGGDVRDV